MKNILIVEDEEILREVFKDELSESGYEITEAKNGQEAINILKDSTPDLVILDIKLPDMNGLRLLELMRREKGAFPILLCTAYEAFRSDYEVWMANISDYIVKPVDLEVLKEKVRKIIG